MPPVRDRHDLCPGVLRPWAAADGLLVRLRLIGGRVPSSALLALGAVAESYGDGRVYLTSRANLQVRGLPSVAGALPPEAVAAVAATGLVPSPERELVRNVMVSPLSGIAGGRASMGPVAARLDARLRTEPGLEGLSARFLFVLDDGRGDLLDRSCDLGAVALDSSEAQLRVGDGWGEVVPLTDLDARLVELASVFVAARGTGPSAPWHVRELDRPLAESLARDPRSPEPTAPLPYGAVPGGEHVRVPESGLDLPAIRALAARAQTLIVTPWRGVLIPEGDLHD